MEPRRHKLNQTFKQTGAEKEKNNNSLEGSRKERKHINIRRASLTVDQMGRRCHPFQKATLLWYIFLLISRFKFNSFSVFIMEVLDLLVPDVLLGPKILSHRLTTVGYTEEHETFVA